MKQWYETLFENYGTKYDRENFVHGTIGECDFIERELDHDRSLRILDIGCGTGRHSLELARRGYSVTGIDLSESMLERAREKAEHLGLRVELRQHDARELPFEGEFDAAIMLCEGGFPLMETDEMNFRILAGASRALRERGTFIFTTLNGLFPLYHSVEQFCASHSDGDSATYRSNTFDLMTFRDHNVTTITDDSGNTRELICNERYYAPCEITWLLSTLGFRNIGIYGARLGSFSREHELTTEDFEMLVIAEKGPSDNLQ